MDFGMTIAIYSLRKVNFSADATALAGCKTKHTLVFDSLSHKGGQSIRRKQDGAGQANLVLGCEAAPAQASNMV